MIEIDGSYGEGGGQILRTAVALSAFLKAPCRITGIRHGRPRPGLRPQHLAGVQALAELCRAEVRGLQLNSQEITFKPGKVAGGEQRIAIGTAGAVGLVLQTLMLPAFSAPSPLRLQITGGTDVPWAPTAGYVKEVAFPIVERMGCHAEMTVVKRGYYPSGGGEVSVELKRAVLSPLQLLDRGEILIIRGRSHASEALRTRGVAERQREGAMAILKKSGSPVKIEVEYRPTKSPGSGIDLWALARHTVLGANALGARGKPAEEVGAEAATALLRQMESGAALDEWMGDQILPFLAAAGGESAITVPLITDHLKTNLWVIDQFLPIETDIRKEKTRAIVTMRSPEPSSYAFNVLKTDELNRRKR
jgi:RNA 3'-phosphate cyclase